MGRYIVYIGYFWFGLQFAIVTMGDFPIQHIDLMTFAFMCDPTTYCACNSWVSVFLDFYSFMYVLGLLSTLDYFFFRILLLHCDCKLFDLRAVWNQSCPVWYVCRYVFLKIPFTSSYLPTQNWFIFTWFFKWL